MRDLLRKRRMWRRPKRLKDAYDVVIIGGGAHGLATAYYLRQHGHHERRGAGEGLHRVGCGGAQHDDPALQLQDARGRALLRRVGEAVRGAGAGPELQPAVQPVRAPDAGPQRPGDVRDGQPRRGQPAAGHRPPADRPRRVQGAGARRCTWGRTRRIRSWARCITRPAASSATTRWCGASRAAPTPAGRRSTPTPRSPGWSAAATASPPCTPTGHGRRRASCSTARRAGRRCCATWPASSCRSPRTSCRRA